MGAPQVTGTHNSPIDLNICQAYSSYFSAAPSQITECSKTDCSWDDAQNSHCGYRAVVNGKSREFFFPTKGRPETQAVSSPLFDPIDMMGDGGFFAKLGTKFVGRKVVVAGVDHIPNYTIMPLIRTISTTTVDNALDAQRVAKSLKWLVVTTLDQYGLSRSFTHKLTAKIGYDLNKSHVFSYMMFGKLTGQGAIDPVFERKVIDAIMDVGREMFLNIRW